MARVPDRFSLIATRVVEPNQALGESGAIYLWLERLDEDNIVSGQPLSYRIGYRDDLARTVDDAQMLLDQGEQLEATIQEVGEGDGVAEGSDPAGGATASTGGASAINSDEYVPGIGLIFETLSPVTLPDKGAL
jgi:hypothetical protein